MAHVVSTRERNETDDRPIEVGAERHLFDVPDEVAYFNTANMSPMLRSVRQAGEAGLARRASPWSVTAPDWFGDVERLRAAFAQILGATPDGVALIPASSYGLAVAARNLPGAPGEQVLVLEDEYPSNYYTWRRFCSRTGSEVVVVRRERGASWSESVRGAINDRVSIVAVPNVHWTDGSLIDLEEVTTSAREVGAVVVIDASQSLGALPLDVSRLQPDFVVSVGYKWLLGPFGLGCLYVAEQHREGEPLEENWINREGSDDFAGLVDYRDEYRPGARRFDVGQRTNFGLVPMALAGAEQLLDWTVCRLAASLRLVTDQIAQRVAELELVTLRRGDRGPHMLGVEIPRERATSLALELKKKGVIASVRGDSLRISPHLHITQTDVDRLIGVLKAAMSRDRTG